MDGMRYRTIVADPPWDYPEGFPSQSRTPGKWAGQIKTKPLPYPPMALEEIKSLPLRALADTDCRLFLWTTNRYLPQSFDVLCSWGFTYKQTLVWHKLDGNMGGSVAPNSAEFLLVAVKGHPPLTGRTQSAVVTHSQGKRHSSKPETFLDIVEQVSPGPYLELFARRNRLGWDTWGNEAIEHVEISPNGLVSDLDRFSILYGGRVGTLFTKAAERISELEAP